MKKDRDCTVPAPNYLQFALTLGEGQQINTHFRFTGNANRYVHIVYVIESAVYVVIFTSCLCENPYERVRAFDTNNEGI